MAIPDSQRNLWNHNRIKIVENTVVFLSARPLLILSKKCTGHFCRKTANKIKSFTKQKHWYLVHTWSDKTFKGTAVNRVLPSLHGGSLEVTSFFFNHVWSRNIHGEIFDGVWSKHRSDLLFKGVADSSAVDSFQNKEIRLD